VQLLANRFLESCRDDLQVQLTIDFSGIQLEAGDIVTVTSLNYGWVAKLFRVSKVTERFAEDGSVSAVLSLLERCLPEAAQLAAPRKTLAANAR
jgi:hypothetical protein